MRKKLTGILLVCVFALAVFGLTGFGTGAADGGKVTTVSAAVTVPEATHTYTLTKNGANFEALKTGAATPLSAGTPAALVALINADAGSGAVKELIFDGGDDGGGNPAALDVGTNPLTLTSGTYIISGGAITGSTAEGTVRLTTNGTALYVTGGEIGTADGGYALYNYGTGGNYVTTNICGGNISATTGYAIYSYSNATVNICGGEVSATTGDAVYNSNSSNITLNISGGEVSTDTGNAIYNLYGPVNISGGTVSAGTGRAVYNARSGKLTVSEADESVPTLITSENVTGTLGTIYLGNDSGVTAGMVVLEMTGGTVENIAESANARTIYNDGAGTVNISGGAVSAAGDGRAIYNIRTGAINISGGTVSADRGYAINNANAGKITVSEADKTNNPTLITSAPTGTLVTIYLGPASVTAGMVVLEITGGTVENTSASASAKAILNASAGTVNISGGEIRATGSGYAISNLGTGATNVSGGKVTATTSYAIHQDGAGTVNISGGTVSADTGIAIYNSSTGKITISEADKTNNPTVITSANTSAGQATIYLRSGTTGETILEITGGTVQNTAGGSNDARAIYNGGAGTVNISGGTVSGTGSGGNANTIVCGSGVVNITGGTVSATAGRAVYLTSATVNISDGALITATTGNAVYHNGAGVLNISGGIVSAISGRAVNNNSTGAINISGGTVSATTGMAVYNYSTGKITISEAAGKTTLITSANVTGTQGTIYMNNAGGSLGITGGEINNSAGGNLIYNAAGATVTLGTENYAGTALSISLTGDTIYTGSAITPTAGINGLQASAYSVSFSGNVNAGTNTASVYASLTGTYGEAVFSRSFTISPKAVTITGLSASNKVYDGGTTAALAGGTLNGAIPNDTVSINSTGVTAAFSDKNTGNGKTVTLSGSYTLSGADAGNYTLTQPAGLTANITAKALTVDGLSASNKVYDGSATAALAGTAALNGVISGDTVSLVSTGAAAAFADKNAGNGKAVTVTGYTLSGSDAGNYTLTQPTGITADITANALTVDGLSASNKVYDGTMAVTLTGGALNGIITGDTVSAVMPVSGTAADKNAGTGKTVSFTAITLTGADAGNYTLTQPAVTVNITKASGTGSVSVEGWTAGKDANDPVLSGVPAEYGAPTYEYKLAGAADSTYTAEVPTKAGDYVVRASFAATTNYNAFSVTYDFTIEGGGLSGGAVAGIIIGCVIVAGAGGFAVFWFVIKKKKFSDLIAVFKKNS